MYGLGVDNPDPLKALEWAFLDDGSDLAAYTDEEIRQMLRDAGADPDEVGRRGQEFVTRLLDKRKRLVAGFKTLLSAAIQDDAIRAGEAIRTLAKAAGVPQVLK